MPLLLSEMVVIFTNWHCRWAPASKCWNSSTPNYPLAWMQQNTLVFAQNRGWTVQLELDCSLLSISLNKHLNTLKNIKNNWNKSFQTLLTLINNFYIHHGFCVMTRMVVPESLTPTISQRDESYSITTNGNQILLSKKTGRNKVCRQCLTRNLHWTYMLVAVYMSSVGHR